MSELADRLGDVRARIEAACEKAGRASADVRLVAVSKTYPAETVLEAMADDFELVTASHFACTYFVAPESRSPCWLIPLIVGRLMWPIL